MRLIITRHAKSSWSNNFLRDHDRQLSDRGERSAALIGQWLSHNGHIPQQVMCSSARRTQETWEGISRWIAKPAQVDMLPELYHAGLRELVQLVRSAEKSPAMIIGHNPGIGDFADFICAKSPDHPDFRRFPTGATLVCDLERQTWRHSIQQSGVVVAFTVPRELE